MAYRKPISTCCALKPYIVRDPYSFISDGPMALNYQALVPAVLETNPCGMVVSSRYNDVYYTGTQGWSLAHHAFIQANSLPQRWQGRDVFTVCETGFGIGLNFMALWQTWRNDPDRCQHLHMVSFEAHPFRLNDLTSLLADLPLEVQPLAQLLLAAWPALLPGIHRLEFEAGAVTLTLVLGDVSRMAKQVSACVDAFFLDGFNPSDNPAMWTPSLFGQLVRLSSQQATLSSRQYTDEVRQHLSLSGFLISTAACGQGGGQLMTGRLRPELGSTAPRQLEFGDITIVGGGIAAAGIAYALAERGHEVTVVDPLFVDGPAGKHHHHLGAAMTPTLSRDDDIRSRLSRAGVALSLQRWRKLSVAARPWRCGTFLPVQAAEQSRWHTALALLQFPKSWVTWLTAAQASEKAGIPLSSGGLWFSQGQRVRPNCLLPALFSHRRIYCRPVIAASLRRLANGKWSVSDPDGREISQASHVVLANAAGAVDLLTGVVPFAQLPKVSAMYQVAGQVSYFRNRNVPCVKVVLASEGYWLPATPEIHVGGSTYHADAAISTITTQGHQDIIGKLAVLLNVLPSVFGPSPGTNEGWAGWRAAVSDRLPVIGPVVTAPGLWLACGYGSHGLTWSALAGELIAAQLHHAPVPLERELLKKIAPR